VSNIAGGPVWCYTGGVPPTSNERLLMSTLATALEAHARKYRPVAIEPNAKRPKSPDWPTTVYTEEEIRQVWANAAVGVGLIWGRGVVDVDLETPAMGQIAARLLPPTAMQWGRPSNPASHRVYEVADEVDRIQLKGPERTLYAEIRGNKCQSVIPPSMHPDGEPYEWVGAPFGGDKGPAPIKLEELEMGLKDCLMVAECLKQWQGGGRHDKAHAVGGLLARAGVALPRAVEMMQVICDLTGDEEAPDRIGRVIEAAERFIAGQEVPGQSKLIECFDEGVAKWMARLYRVELDPSSKQTADKPWNDLGNARWLEEHHGEELIYVYENRQWAMWDSKHWLIEGHLEERKRAHDTLGTMRQYAAALDNRQERSAFMAHIIKSESAKSIDAMIKESRVMLRASRAAFDTHPMLFNTQNVTIDLETGEVLPHNKAHLLTKVSPITYDPHATCPRWFDFLKRITNGDGELEKYLQMIAGYCMAGTTREQCLFFLYGSGGNGKTTYTETVAHVLGDYHAKTPTETLMSKKVSSGANNDVARLAGARMVTAAEANSGQAFAEALIKDLTGGDRIAARFLYGEYFSFSPQFTLILYGNHKPTIRGTDHGIWRRIRLVPFTWKIDPQEDDKKYGEKLRAEESSGVLNWMLEGCRLWLAEGLLTPKAVADATLEYRNEMDAVGDFLQDRYATPGDYEKGTEEYKEAARAQELMLEVYQEYVDWAIQGGENRMTQRQLGQKLVDRGITKKRSNGKWYFVGMKTRRLR
jgi:putative DNA primase/helicase